MKYVREIWEVFHVTNNSSRWASTNKYKRYWWVSNYGRIRTTFNYKDDIQYPMPAPTGGHNKEGQRYWAISINEACEKYVHRLVATYFVDNPNPDEYDVVHHKDHDKSNNHYTNLEWCTDTMNKQYYSEWYQKNKKQDEAAG